MRHLRNNGISINGSTQKRQLRNEGYFHGYKGYRFFRYPEHKINSKQPEKINSSVIFQAASEYQAILGIPVLLAGSLFYEET